MLHPLPVRAMFVLMLPGSAVAQVPPPTTTVPSEGVAPPAAEAPQSPTPVPSVEQQESSAEQPEPEPPSAAESAPALQAEPGGADETIQAGEQASPPVDATFSAPLATRTDPSAPETLDGVIDEPPYSGPLGTHQRHLFAWMGVRNDYVRDERFDMFGSNDAFTAFSLGVGAVTLSVGELSLAQVLFWETAGKEADARGDNTDLRVHRFELGPELRYHLHYRLYGFARLGVGAQYSKAVIESQLTGSEFAAKDWVFSSSLTGGVAVQFFGPTSGELRAPRGWFVADGGYALSSDASLNFRPTDSGSRASPERAQMDDFGTLGFSAPLFRLALAGSY